MAGRSGPRPALRDDTRGAARFDGRAMGERPVLPGARASTENLTAETRPLASAGPWRCFSVARARRSVCPSRATSPAEKRAENRTETSPAARGFARAHPTISRMVRRAERRLPAGWGEPGDTVGADLRDTSSRLSRRAASRTPRAVDEPRPRRSDAHARERRSSAGAHVNHIFAKAGVRGRAQAVRYADHEGLAPPNA